MFAWVSHALDELETEAGQPLRHRLHRLYCAVTCGLCLGVIFPINLFQHLPIWCNAVVGLLGLCSGWFYRASTRGRSHFHGFYALLLVLVNIIWFFNGGSEGSIAYFFFPILLYPLTVFQGRFSGLMVTLLLLDLCGLLVLDYYQPNLTTPFLHPSDRLLDLLGSAVCSFVAMGVMLWVLRSTYERQHQRLTDTTRELAASEQNYREIFNATSDALFIHDATGRLIDLNERMSSMFGYNRAEALRLSIDELSLGQSPYSQAEALQHIQRALQEGPQVFRWRSRRRNGELFWSEVAVRSGEIAGQKRVIVAVRDISARAQAEQALQLSEERLRLSLSASQQAWFDLNLVTGEASTSEEYARMLGMDPRAFRATRQGWMDNLHPDDRAVAQGIFQSCLATGETVMFEYRRQAQPDGWKWIRSIARIVERDANGRPLRMAGTHTDITERKELEARLLHSQRLESIGTIAGGVAHDLNNILTPMLMASSVLEKQLTNAQDREMMALIESGAKRGAAIVRQLLTFSRNIPSRRVELDPRQSIREILGVMCTTFPAGIKLVERLPAGIWPVLADATQLQQVLMNLCVNARDAMPGGGTLTIVAENLVPESTRNSHHPWSKGQRLVVITVSDTGHGIPAEIIDRVFDPYFTTKAVGEGSGLGLATVHGIVKDHGGTITVTSVPNEGTSFRIMLPAVDTNIFPRATHP